MVAAQQRRYASAPFFDDVANAPAHKECVWLRAVDGVRLRAAHFPCAGEEQGRVALFTGRSEYIEKYGRVIARLGELGLSVFICDWRGQGLSDRLTENSMMGHVDDFSSYQRDVAAFISYIKSRTEAPIDLLLAHSMGGAIALRALFEGHEGFAPRRVMFSAPMWGIYIMPQLRDLAQSVARYAPKLGMGKLYAPSNGPWNYVELHPFRGNSLTNDPELYAWMRMQVKMHPELGLGGPSIDWVNAGFRETQALSQLPSPDLPCLTLLGDEESVVDQQAIATRMEAWPGGELVVMEEAQHEVLMETPKVQAHVYRHLKRFCAL